MYAALMNPFPYPKADRIVRMSAKVKGVHCFGTVASPQMESDLRLAARRCWQRAEHIREIASPCEKWSSD